MVQSRPPVSSKMWWCSFFYFTCRSIVVTFNVTVAFNISYYSVKKYFCIFFKSPQATAKFPPLPKLNFLFSSPFCLSASLADLIWFITYFIQGWLSHIILIHMLMCSWDDPPWLAERELEIFLLVSLLALHSVCLLLSQQPNPPWKPSFITSPTHRILLTYLVFFPAVGKAYLG